LREGLIQFCDSAGQGPSGTMDRIMRKFAEYYLRTTGQTPTVQINTKSYQRDGFSCGVYSYHFIRSRLAGVTWEQYFRKAMGKEIATCRKAMFRGADSDSEMDPRCIPENMLS